MQTYSLNLREAPQALTDACLARSLHLQKERPLEADLVIWEAADKPWGSLTAEQAAYQMRRVQKGGGLLLSLAPSPGLAPVMLGPMLPTTGWATQWHRSPYTPVQSLQVAQSDASFFSSALDGLPVPFCFDIRPASAIERGQSRYERYSFVHPLLKTQVAADTDSWSRSLLNREWTVRAQCNDVARLPLVISGLYGAGRVVMIGTSAASLGGAAAAHPFWLSIVQWLQQAEVASDEPALPGLVSSFERDQATIILSNTGHESLPVQLVMRALSQEGALLADGSGELQRRLRLPAAGSSTIRLPLPGPSAIADSALDANKALKVRVGVLSGSGAQLLVEQRGLSAQAPLQVSVETQNLYGLPYAFHAPGPQALHEFQARMGAFVGAYAYPPGHAVRGSVVLSNGCTNVAPLASVRDLTTPANTSVMALNDRATGIREAPGPDKINGYSMWTGKAGVENVLEFVLPPRAQITEVVIVGSYGSYLNGEAHNPGQVLLEADGRQIAVNEELDALFAEGYGQARISFAPCPAKTLTVRFPWVAQGKDGRRQAPWLGEIRVQGWPHDPPPQASGQLVVSLVDALGGRRVPILDRVVELPGCSSQRVPFSVQLPELSGVHFFRLEAHFEALVSHAPLLMIEPRKTLAPLSDLFASQMPDVGFNVSRGFREVSRIGTGTAEQMPGWAMPDDLIWAYSRRLKKVSATARTEASRLYVTDTDMRHYVTPWGLFPNGDPFLPATAAQLVDIYRNHPKWSQSSTAVLHFVDGWDTGPDLAMLQDWPELIAFDSMLRVAQGASLEGGTREEIVQDLHTRFENEWQAWQLDRYFESVSALQKAFLAAGKHVVISGQGLPMVAGEKGRALAAVFRGMNDDCTWGMLDNSPVLSTGRQMSELAFNPVWQMSTLVPWGFNAPVFNSWQWHSPVSTTEPSRRSIYDRAWRATIWPSGEYASLYTYGYTSNVGIAYTMTEEEFQLWWHVQELHSLVAPESPVGAGLVISTKAAADPKHIRFTCWDPLTLEEPRLLAEAFRNLHNAGLSLPFAANAESLKNWSATVPLIILNLADFSPVEVESLRALHERGTPLAAFAEAASLSAPAAALFAQPRTLLLSQAAATLTHPEALAIATTLQTLFKTPLRFPEGTAGYGFRSQDTLFIVLEDWQERGRHVAVELDKTQGARSASACSVNDHQTLEVLDRGSMWLIQVPLRSGDGMLIAVKET